MDLNNKKGKGGVALASRRLGRVEKGQPLILGANKMEGGYNFAVEASEDSEVSLLLYKKRGAASPVEIVFPSKGFPYRTCVGTEAVQCFSEGF